MRKAEMHSHEPVAGYSIKTRLALNIQG